MISSKKALKQLKELEILGKKMRLAADGWDNDWQTLIAIILSARTRDETTIKVCKKIFSKYPNPEKFSKLSLYSIKKLIYSVNFFNNKSKNIFLCTKKILNEYSGKVPEKFEELTKLPGVGRKTANVFLAEKGKQNIGVDTHVTYISNYLDWANSKKQNEIEKSLKRLFPKNKHKDLNWILVQFGKTHTSKKLKNEILDKIKKIN
ncbi:MAG: endonuclease III [Candidatus Pacearchaeota archaeon]|jgi:endonuclease-3